MECHNYSFFQLFSFSTWEVFLHLMATFKRWFVMTAWAGVAFFKGTSLCQVKWLGLMKMVFLAMTLEAMLCKLMWEVGRCTQSCSHSDVFNWFAMVACFIVNIQENALCSTFLIDVLKFYDAVMCLRSKSKSLLSTLKYELEGCGWRAFRVAATIICGILYWIT